MLTTPLLNLRQVATFGPVPTGDYRALDSRWGQSSFSPLQRGEPANEDEPDLASKLQIAFAACKDELSAVAMHLPSEFRIRTLRQLRNLLSIDGWDEGDNLISVQSFKSFARGMALLQPRKRPMLGLANNGSVLAMWATGNDRATLEHLAQDRVKWFISRELPDGSESAAGATTIRRLAEIVDVQGVRALIDG